MNTELEYKLLNSYKEEIVEFLASNQECYNEAVALAISDNQPLSWRAAWLLTSCIDENDSRIKKYISKLIKAAETKKGGHQRELIKILHKMELSESREGKVFDICMNVWEDITNTPSERYVALRFIIKCTKKYPELISEIKFLLEDHFLETLTPGAKRSILKIKKGLGF